MNIPSSASRCSCVFLFQCLVEAVCILDSVCIEDPSLVYRTFPYIKALFGRLSSDLSFARVLLPIAQFYLNHGKNRALKKNQHTRLEGCEKQRLMKPVLTARRRDGCGGLRRRVEAGVRPIPRRAVQWPLPGTRTAALPPAEPGEPAAGGPRVHSLLPKFAEGERGVF